MYDNFNNEDSPPTIWPSYVARIRLRLSISILIILSSSTVLKYSIGYQWPCRATEDNSHFTAFLLSTSCGTANSIEFGHSLNSHQHIYFEHSRFHERK